MTFSTLALAAVAQALVTTAAFANPTFDNVLDLIDTGIDNRLQIIQPAEGGGNSLSISITGNGNGGFGQDWGMPELFADFPAPGRIEQIGTLNSARLEVFGNSNLFSILQTGTRNSVSGFISGSNNAAAVVQAGFGNVAQFRQVGTGNTLAISQRAW